MLGINAYAFYQAAGGPSRSYEPRRGPQSTLSFCLSSPCQQIQGHLYLTNPLALHFPFIFCLTLYVSIGCYSFPLTFKGYLSKSASNLIHPAQKLFWLWKQYCIVAISLLYTHFKVYFVTFKHWFILLFNSFVNQYLFSFCSVSFHAHPFPLFCSIYSPTTYHYSFDSRLLYVHSFYMFKFFPPFHQHFYFNYH